MVSERGSILPLGIGLVAISLVVALVLSELVGVEIQTHRNKQLSDLLVLKVAGELIRDRVSPVTGLEYLGALNDTASSASEFLGIQPTRISVMSYDGKTIEGLVCTNWQSITGLKMGSFGKVCASSKARAIS